ncbi:MAG TPA: XrtA-associated tyrosine autokinase [Geobacteraceae bacterium]|nr:XrtA-associated tyrosine autokinase [Geobacteraceae bacterium]
MSRLEEALEKAAQLRKKLEVRDSTAKSAVAPPGAAVGARPVLPPVTSDNLAVKIDNPFIVTLRDPASPIAEEYRKLKSIIMKLTKKDNYLNTLMVTSTFSNEGKSITALNLAITMAQEYDHTILLVDADVRNTTLHKYLNVTPKAGLTECILGEIDVSDALVRTGIGKLSFLPAGRQVKDPAELLSSNRMREFLTEMKNRYPDRYIIIDAPPVQSCAETLSLGHMVDGVLFLVMEGVASVDNIQEALTLLMDANVLGIIYNNASVDAFGGYYGYHGYHGQKYGYGKKEETHAQV